ncbi:MAG: hypothetical protein V4772_22745, partial [Pseudomonadota bacterium]
GPRKERHLCKRAALLDGWVKRIAFICPPALRRYYVPSMSLDTLLQHVGQVIATHEVAYAVSFEEAQWPKPDEPEPNRQAKYLGRAQDLRSFSRFTFLQMFLGRPRKVS